MNTSPRWMNALVIGPLAVLTLQGLTVNAFALTDTNAELREAAADRQAHVAAPATKAARPAQVAWVPVSAKRLDGFKPVLPAERGDVPRQTLARADAR
ncbi:MULTISPECIES: hypothetical protein [Roseateles]|uniref:Uncharacterized protein n=1 Tax=Pelomonas caseinilytica TaxID=2906763 RepID=A0ABS8XBR9_9BURK|nr:MULTISPECIES: hypothetical protein [unclassified Roseateles]MCE4536812.1 hypothetical protein [Pelomonas sp. P7]HEV6966772.1 hypothetical protein [Roseateles sp.]